MTLAYSDGDYATSNSAVFVLFRQGNKLAFVLRSNTGWMDGHYGLPGGRVDHGESFTQAALREAKEEVGVSLSKGDLAFVTAWQRHHDDSDWADIVFEAKQWEGELVNAEPEVHGELAWLDLDDLPENVIPGIRLMLDHVSKGKKLIESGWEEN